jgi:hypothetical protein
VKPIAVFFHCVFVMGDPPKPLEAAAAIVAEQMEELERSGLLKEAREFHVGVNGWEESRKYVAQLIPPKAVVKYHGLASRSENLTIAMLENWAKSHPGWNVLYFHSKGATHPLTNADGMMNTVWRRGMMSDLVYNWPRCIGDLARHDIVCPWWYWNAADGTQHIPAGNFLWITSDFAARLPSIYERHKIKDCGIAALESRYEAEVYWGNGPRPRVKSYRQLMWWWRMNRV